MRWSSILKICHEIVDLFCVRNILILLYIYIYIYVRGEGEGANYLGKQTICLGVGDDVQVHIEGIGRNKDI